MTWTVAADTAEPIEPARGGSRVRSRFLHDPVAMSGATFIVVLVAAAVFAPEVAPDSPYKNFAAINAGPSSAHWLGTDDIGRDILSRLIYGARISLEAATIIVVLALVVAVPIGLVAGYFAGRTDNVLMRLMDALFAFPPLILAITVVALRGRSLHNESHRHRRHVHPRICPRDPRTGAGRAGGDVHRGVTVGRGRPVAHDLAVTCSRTWRPR